MVLFLHLVETQMLLAPLLLVERQQAQKEMVAEQVEMADSPDTTMLVVLVAVQLVTLVMEVVDHLVITMAMAVEREAQDLVAVDRVELPPAATAAAAVE